MPAKHMQSVKLFDRLARNSRTFKTMFAGMAAPEFDLLRAREAEKKTPNDGQKEILLLSAKKGRKRDIIGAGNPSAPT